MSSTFVALFLALIAGIGLLVLLGMLSLCIGAYQFLFAVPRIDIYKSKYHYQGLALRLCWDPGEGTIKYDCLKLRLFNPFGTPSQLEIIKEIEAFGPVFVLDLDLGDQMARLQQASNLEQAIVEVVLVSSEASITHLKNFRGQEFVYQVTTAIETLDELAARNKQRKDGTLMAPPMTNAKVLKIAENPEFADRSGGGGRENFKVAKAWIEPGCIVCNACESIYPEVFHVTETNCLIRPNAPLDDGLRIDEAARACPVEVIKFQKA